MCWFPQYHYLSKMENKSTKDSKRNCKRSKVCWTAGRRSEDWISLLFWNDKQDWFSVHFSNSKFNRLPMLTTTLRMAFLLINILLIIAFCSTWLLNFLSDSSEDITNWTGSTIGLTTGFFIILVALVIFLTWWRMNRKNKIQFI